MGADGTASADATDLAASADQGCPDGTSLVSGICLKDPPKHTTRSDSGGGGCQAGGGVWPGESWTYKMGAWPGNVSVAS